MIPATDTETTPAATALDHRRVTGGVVASQFLLGFVLQILIALPFLRRVHGANRLPPARRHLFVANHVSLLDTLLLACIFWRLKRWPILVLGDKRIWHASWIRRLLSRSTAFLLERGKLNPNRIAELQAFGRSGREFQLIVFPEGTRGDGVNVAACQPGIYHIAQAARLDIVPVFIENMQLVSTKTGRFHPIRGWRKVEIHFGDPIPPDAYLGLPRDEFVEFIRRNISDTGKRGKSFPQND
jgi:1-acyl-sn-glycerol-3-phosphate acyltransferase